LFLSSQAGREVEALASQLGMDMSLLLHEIRWALGEQRINRVTPSRDQFWEWSRERDGLTKFWCFANAELGVTLLPEEVSDLWECIALTINARKRRAFTFADYLMIAVHSEHACAYCGERPPKVSLEIDHILPVSKGGSDLHYNLRFLCQHCNRARGNRFRWAEVWRRLV
jgi:HNH endonuclease